MELEGRVAVITGGARGIGRGLARRFAAEGMRVVLADLDPVPLNEVVGQLNRAGVDAIAARTDVSDPDEVAALADTTLERFGAVHVLCNNAGVGPFGPVEDLTLDDWRWTLSVNLWGPIHGIRAFLPIMEEQREGHLNSTASESGLYGTPFLAAYNVSKFGVVGLMSSLERDLRARNSPVRASVLCPAATRTDILDSERDRPEDLRSDGREADDTAAFRGRVESAVGGGQDPEDVAAAVVDAIEHDRFWVFPDDHVPATALRQAEAMAYDGTLMDLG